MKILCIRPEHNSPGKRDVTGAFAPEALKCIDALGQGGTVIFDNRKAMPTRRRQVLELLSDLDDYDAVAFFCHGWSRGLQAGFTRANIEELAPALLRVTAKRRAGAVQVTLYCCSTGDDPQDMADEAAGTGDNSFADLLRDAFCKQGAIDCRVVAHTTVGHASKNPYVKFFDGMNSHVGGTGGYFPVMPGSKPLWPKWRKALRENDLRFRMPFMDVEHLHSELLRA